MAVRAGEHTKCLDLFQVASSAGTGKPFCDCAILLEVWDVGGLLQTNLAIPEGTVISISAIGNGIKNQKKNLKICKKIKQYE